MKKVYLIVLDSLGIGEAPDAADFGDKGADTLRRISKSEKFSIENLIEMGLGNIDGIDYLPKTERAGAAVARLRELSRGKDTTVGHWELAGVVSRESLPTYPDGFPDEIISAFEEAAGVGVLCNKPYSGTVVINEYGDEHLKSGKLIVYTSADSVFQIAAHEDIVPPNKLYEYCRIARKILVGKHAVGRVIARPFIGESGNFKRTANRRDFSALPPEKTVLDALVSHGLASVSVGKIRDIFAGQGISIAKEAHGNREAMAAADELISLDFRGLAFINLVDFDMNFGHRQDVDGYAGALSEFDAWLGEFKKKLSSEDILIITADHGCDPGDNSTDHTREYVPLLVWGERVNRINLNTLTGFGTVANLVARLFGVDYTSAGGEDIYEKIIKGAGQNE